MSGVCLYKAGLTVGRDRSVALRTISTVCFGAKAQMDADAVFNAPPASDGAEKSLHPLYAVSSVSTDRTENLSCSSNSSWCYFCEYAGETGLCVDLRAHVHELARRGYEVPAIAKAVHKIYKRDLQPHCERVRPNGQVEQAPAWSIESITRHLVYGGEFDDVFQTSVVRNVFTHLIMRLQERVLTESGVVDESSRVALLHTIREQANWKRSVVATHATSSVPVSGPNKRKKP